AVPELSAGAVVLSPIGWVLFIYAAFLSSVAFALWYSLLKSNYAGEIGMYIFIVPVSGSVLSAMFMPDERLTISIFAGMALVAIGIVIINYRGKQTSKNEAKQLAIKSK